MRLIDADAIEKAVRKRVYAIEVDDILAEIANAPSIDIVRCKECKHRGICFGRLVQGTKVVQLNFCSYGERRTDDEV